MNPSEERGLAVYLYCIEAGEGGPVKIGTAVSPKQRMRQLQTGNHLRLALVGAIDAGDDADRVERLIHSQLVDYRLTGEWYRREALDELAWIHAAEALEESSEPIRTRRRAAEMKYGLMCVIRRRILRRGVAKRVLAYVGERP